jgi:hypothetical protein
VASFRDCYGPTMSAFDAAQKSGRAAQLEAELVELFTRQNQSQTGTSIPATFLRVEVRVS